MADLHGVAACEHVWCALISAGAIAGALLVGGGGSTVPEDAQEASINLQAASSSGLTGVGDAAGMRSLSTVKSLIGACFADCGVACGERYCCFVCPWLNSHNV